MWYGNEEFSLATAGIIFTSDLFFFLLSAIVVKRITADLIWKAAGYSLAVSVAAFISQFFAVKNFFYVIPAALSGFLGTFIGVYYERKRRRAAQLTVIVPIKKDKEAAAQN